MKIICKSLIELPEAAQALIQTHADKRLFAFDGSMGVGKNYVYKRNLYSIRSGEYGK